MKSFLLTLLLAFNLNFFGQTISPNFSNISIDKFGNIKWTVTYFQNGHSFEIVIDQLKDGKWIRKGGLAGIVNFNAEKSSPKIEVSEGSCQVKFHKGSNIFRLRMTYPSQVISNEFELISDISNDDGSLWIMDNVIYLDNVEHYEILDKIGSTLLKNESKAIDISALPPGNYFLYTKKFTIPFTK